ncbi:hypothetical protein F5148DRAFT_339032 [Russula earlei]|uniref:Uncharacterized protein n=1 Tax=Russula earlei TaxID=71964 RepID=A0ACC0U1D6_9AGAM|nr:hypothetical protein F5148DRAFT_339032 [Russula earlei]
MLAHEACLGARAGKPGIWRVGPHGWGTSAIFIFGALLWHDVHRRNIYATELCAAVLRGEGPSTFVTRSCAAAVRRGVRDEPDDAARRASQSLQPSRTLVGPSVNRSARGSRRRDSVFTHLSVRTTSWFGDGSRYTRTHSRRVMVVEQIRIFFRKKPWRSGETEIRETRTAN